MIDYDDKRDFYRMMLNTDVNVTIIDDETNSKMQAICRDLSATGIAIEMPHPIDLNTMVKVSVESSGSNVLPLDVSGKVVRITEEANNCFLVGIHISEID